MCGNQNLMLDIGGIFILTMFVIIKIVKNIVAVIIMDFYTTSLNTRTYHLIVSFKNYSELEETCFMS